MPDPTLEAIRARLANHTQVLTHMHYRQDVGVLLERVDGLERELEDAVGNRDQRTERLLAHASAAVDELTRDKRSLQARLDAVRAWARKEGRDVEELRVVLEVDGT